ncbi:hypothetical protein [Maribacter litopenaei]|uniref:hypothetical protein n=1 Tax=Maribacter litopenaei TaxID=2976127 RepID=UPI0030840A77
MDVQEYIASGILELYVAGILSEKENLEVHTYAQEYPEIKAEIEAIEAAVLEISHKATNLPAKGFETLKPRLENSGETKVIPIQRKPVSWTAYIGWAASILLAIGLFGYTTKTKHWNPN